MSDFLAIMKAVGLPVAMLLVGIVALWRERVAERAKAEARLDAQIRDLQVELSKKDEELTKTRAELYESRQEHLKDAERFLHELELRSEETPPRFPPGKSPQRLR